MDGAPTAGMGPNVGDEVIHRLYAWGVRTIFGEPGAGLAGAIDRAGGRVRVVRREPAAAEARAHARHTGELGVCVATSTAGARRLIGGLRDAKDDRVPVIALIAAAAAARAPALDGLFTGAAHHHAHTCARPVRARHLLDRAIRIAITERTVTCVIFDHDLA